MKGYVVVAIPGVRDCLHFVTGYTACLMKWAVCVLGFMWRGAKKSHDGSSAKDCYDIVVHSMHSHCDWDQVIVT